MQLAVDVQAIIQSFTSSKNETRFNIVLGEHGLADLNTLDRIVKAGQTVSLRIASNQAALDETPAPTSDFAPTSDDEKQEAPSAVSEGASLEAPAQAPTPSRSRHKKDIGPEPEAYEEKPAQGPGKVVAFAAPAR